MKSKITKKFNFLMSDNYLLYILSPFIFFNDLTNTYPIKTIQILKSIHNKC